eukprot:TRINITY_DN3343_c0_g2_i1.p1 TRINITY_DN3343_c0_g2~~TRINITY_DN3343_c0_g2_i1.p1  ORF type:complete len:796 (+),score=176.24 TRINITY_DN3343_c0_g2_i1:42-2429(+)
MNMATTQRQRPSKLNSDILSKFEKKKVTPQSGEQPQASKTLEDVVTTDDTTGQRPQRRQIRRTHSLFSESKGFWQDEEQKRKQALFGRMAAKAAEEAAENDTDKETTSTTPATEQDGFKRTQSIVSDMSFDKFKKSSGSESPSLNASSEVTRSVSSLGARSSPRTLEYSKTEPTITTTPTPIPTPIPSTSTPTPAPTSVATPVATQTETATIEPPVPATERRTLQRRNWGEKKGAQQENPALVAMREKQALVQKAKEEQEARKREEEIRQAEEAKKRVEEAQRAEEARKAEEARRAEEARQAEEARKIEDRKAQEASKQPPRFDFKHLEAAAGLEEKPPSPRTIHSRARSRTGSTSHKLASVASTMTEEIRRNSVTIQKQEEARAKKLEIQYMKQLQEDTPVAAEPEHVQVATPAPNASAVSLTPSGTLRPSKTETTEDRLRLLSKQNKQTMKEELKRLEGEEEKRNQMIAAKLAEWEATVQAVLEPPEEDDDEELDLSIVMADIKENKTQIVNLALWGLEDDSASDILEALAENTSVTSLFLDGNELEAKSFLRLNDMLQRNKTLKHLSINYVMLGDLGARTVAEGFAKNNTVKALSASGNDLEESGMEGLIEGLKHNTTITTLILKENTISDSGCEVLQKFMSTNKSITYLDISNNYIGEEGASHLATMLLTNSTLLHLNLSRNSLEDAGCILIAHALAKSPTLECLDIGDNIIGTAGIVELAAALKHNRSLKRLDLRGRENLFALQAEFSLQDALLGRTDGLQILWKREGTQPTKPKVTDIQSVVDYLGDER